MLCESHVGSNPISSTISCPEDRFMRSGAGVHMTVPNADTQAKAAARHADDKLEFLY